MYPLFVYPGESAPQSDEYVASSTFVHFIPKPYSRFLLALHSMFYGYLVGPLGVYS
jgi:hypothetical protein